MIKRYTPEHPDGVRVEFSLPDDYILGTKITLFANGQLVNSFEKIDHPYGYFLDAIEKKFTLYVAPYADESLYLMYEIDDLIDITFDNIDWDKKIKSIDFSTEVYENSWNIGFYDIQWEEKTSKNDWKTLNQEINWENKEIGIEFEYTKCSL